MIPYYRFPLKNKSALEEWENFVKDANKIDAEWKANCSSRICSDHFEPDNYIIPPSSNATCRLKRRAIPSVSQVSNITNIPYELQSRIGPCYKRPMPPSDNEDLLPPEKIPKVSAEERRDELQKKLKHRIKELQQQLRRSKKKAKTMGEVIKTLEEKLVIDSKEAECLCSTFKNTHLEFLYNFRDNVNASPSARRYSDEIEEFALTLYFYSPKAYKYVRSIVPLPNPSLIRKWSSNCKCDPGFIEEAFSSLSTEAAVSPVNKDCSLVIDAMSIRKQTLWNSEKDQYSGFVDFGGEIPCDHTDKLASETLVFLLVGTRSHWKCPIGYFLVDKLSAKDQAQLISKSLEKAAKAGLKVWSVTADGTAVNVKTFELLGCNFTGDYDKMKTSFKHPTTGEDIFAIMDPCHMLKLARNALSHLESFVDGEGNIIRWQYLEELIKIQQQEGLN